MSEATRILKMTSDSNYAGYSFCSEAEQMALKVKSLQSQLSAERERNRELVEALGNEFEAWTDTWKDAETKGDEFMGAFAKQRINCIGEVLSPSSNCGKDKHLKTQKLQEQYDQIGDHGRECDCYFCDPQI